MSPPPAFVIPLTFRREKSDLLEQSCSCARPSVIRSWGHVMTFKHTDSEARASEGGCAMGTQDGTLFLFSQICRTEPLVSRPSHLLESRSPSRSRSSTPTSPPPFNLTQRASVVSGVTTEQVEAPKNYVDFEEEPEKLKDILQGRQPKEPVKPPTSKDSPSPVPKRNVIQKSLLSAINSAAFTTSSSHPSSPGSSPEYSNLLDLWCHVILPNRGPGRGVTSVRPIEDNQLIVVLQETGDLSVISLKDGSCMATVSLSRQAPNPPINVEDKEFLQALWFWNHLKVYELQETTIILIAATINPTAPQPPSLDFADNGVQDKSRIAIFELHCHELDVNLNLIGQWYFEGPSYSLGLHQEVDKSMKLFQLSREGHFLSRRIHLFPRVISQRDIQLPGKDVSNLNIPNPFKSLKPHHAEHSSPAETAKETRRIACDNVIDLGELLKGETILGFHARGARRKTFGVAWSEKHLTVIDGRLRQSSLIQMISGSSKLMPSSDVSEVALNGFITSLFVVSNGRMKEKFIVGGADDGSVAFWTSDLYLIPGSSTPLLKVCTGPTNLLLVYADNRARLWDVKTQEFWRSMAEEKAEEMLKQGGWSEIVIDIRRREQNIFLESIPNLTFPDTSSTLLLDLEHFISASVAVAKSISTNRAQTRAILRTLERLRSVLSVLLTPGLNLDIDAICFGKLGIRPSQAFSGVSRNETVTLYRRTSSRELWCFSNDVSASRALSIVVMLNALSVFEEFMEGANTVMIFYATSLASAVGPKYQPPSLVYLARRWFDGSNDVRKATRVLFDYATACMSDGDTIEIAEHWQHHCRHNDSPSSSS
ncbi:hypothetical protein C0993_007868 [Termitomyces sp. T159_Od127]|nr:hypothetical protein C0993_007868 [Termitomyces sp. T159_Od127]